MNYIICRYSEIGLKGRNRKFFEEKLIENIKKNPNFSAGGFLDYQEIISSVKRISGRIIIELTKKGEENKKLLEKSIPFVLGISSFSFAKKIPQKIEEIEKEVLKNSKEFKFKTFKVSAKRSEKTYPLSSQEINERVGHCLLKKNKKIKVDLNNPEVIFFIDIVEKEAFIYNKKIECFGGLPVGSSGRALSLISGGIDSPVASFLAMKRGLEIVFVHFHSYPETPKSSIDKVKELTNILSLYQPKTKVYLIPIAELQREISLNVSEKLRVIFYRKLMFKISEKIAKKEKIKTIITGDSLGQVASQTIENMKEIERNINCLIIRPLACMDKIEIVKKAQEIKTFEVSILPYDDCCSRFLPKRPQTKAKEEEMIREEKNINIEDMANRAIKKIEILTNN